MPDPNNPTDYPNAGSGAALGWPQARERGKRAVTGYVGVPPDPTSPHPDDGALIEYVGYVANGNSSGYLPTYIGHYRSVIDHYGPELDESGNPVAHYVTEVDPRFASLLPYAFGFQGRARLGSQFDDRDERISLTVPNAAGTSISQSLELDSPGYISSEFRMFLEYANNDSSGFDVSGGPYTAETSQGSSNTGFAGDSPSGGGGGYTGGTLAFGYFDGGTITGSGTMVAPGGGSFVLGDLRAGYGVPVLADPSLSYTAIPGTLAGYHLDASQSRPWHVSGGVPQVTITHPITGYRWIITDSVGLNFQTITSDPHLDYEYKGTQSSFTVQMDLIGPDGERGVSVQLTAGGGGATALTVSPPTSTGPTRVIADTRGSTPPLDVLFNPIPLTKVHYDWGDGTKTVENFGVLAYHNYKSSGDYIVKAQAYAGSRPVPAAQASTSQALACKVSGVLHITHDAPPGANVVTQTAALTVDSTGSHFVATFPDLPAGVSENDCTYRVVTTSSFKFAGLTFGDATLEPSPTLRSPGYPVFAPAGTYMFTAAQEEHLNPRRFDYGVPTNGLTISQLLATLTFSRTFPELGVGSGVGAVPPLRVTWPAGKQLGALQGGVAVLEAGDTFDAKLKLASLKPSDFNYELVLGTPVTSTVVQTASVALDQHAVAVTGGSTVIGSPVSAVLGPLPDGAVVTSFTLEWDWHYTDGGQFGSTIVVSLQRPDTNAFVGASFRGSPSTTGYSGETHPAVTDITGDKTLPAYNVVVTNGGTAQDAGNDVTVGHATLTRTFTITTDGYTTFDETHAQVDGGPENEVITWTDGVPNFIQKTQDLDVKWAFSQISWTATQTPPSGVQDGMYLSSTNPGSEIRINAYYLSGYLSDSQIAELRGVLFYVVGTSDDRFGLFTDSSHTIPIGTPGVGNLGRVVRKKPGAIFTLPQFSTLFINGNSTLRTAVPKTTTGTNSDFGIVSGDSLPLPTFSDIASLVTDEGFASLGNAIIPVEDFQFPNLNVDPYNPDAPRVGTWHWVPGTINHYFYALGDAIESDAQAVQLQLSALAYDGVVLHGTHAGVNTVTTPSGVFATPTFFGTPEYSPQGYYQSDGSFVRPTDRRDTVRISDDANLNADAASELTHLGPFGAAAVTFEPVTGGLIDYPRSAASQLRARRSYRLAQPGSGGVLAVSTAKFTCDKDAPDDPVPPFVPDYNLKGLQGPDFVNFTRTT